MPLRTVPWSTDHNDILAALNAAIDARLPVLLHCRGRRPVRSRLVGVRVFGDRAYLVLKKPPTLTDVRVVREALVKLPGLPVLVFSCPITRQGPTTMATMLPTAVSHVELRAAPRLTSPKGSMATFFVTHRSRVSICMMENISIGGAKLVGQPAHEVKPGDRIGPCTLSLAGRNALIDREVTIEEGEIVRVAANDGGDGQWGLGIKFSLDDRKKAELAEVMERIKG